MNYKIKTTVYNYIEDIPLQFFMTRKEREEIKGKTVNIIVSLDRVTSMRVLVNIIDCIRKAGFFDDEQKIEFKLANYDNRPDCVDVEITA